MHPGRRLPTWAFIIAPVLALCLFTVYFLQIRAEPFARHLVANPIIYDIQARHILTGEPHGKAFLLSPLYPGFIALVYKLARPDHLMVPLAQGILLALNVFLLALVSRRLMGDVSGLIASFLMAFYWSFYYFAGELVPVTLLLTFMLLAVLLFLDRNEGPSVACIGGGWLLAAALFIMRGLPGIVDPGAGEAHLASLLLAVVFIAGSAVLLAVILLSPRLRRLTNLAGCGVLLGTACLVWGAMLVLAVPLFLLILYEAAGRPAASAGLPMRAGVFIIALAIPIAAAFSHNLVATGEPVLLTTSLGVNIFIGNNSDSDGMDPFRFGEDDVVRREADRLRLSGSRRSRFFADHAYEYIKNDPRGWLALLQRKALLSISRYEIDNNADISERRSAWKRFFAPGLHFGIVFPLALVGFLEALRRRGDGTLAVWGCLGFTAVCIVFFVCERFRLPGIVFLLPLAVAGAELVAKGLAGRTRGGALAVVLMIAGAAAANIDFLSVADYEFPSVIVNKAYVERLDGDFERARLLSHLAISREPGNAGAHYQLGAIEEAQNNPVSAMQYYLRAIELDPFRIAHSRGAARILEAAGVSTAYVDRFVEMSMRGEGTADLKRQIEDFVQARVRAPDVE